MGSNPTEGTMRILILEDNFYIVGQILTRLVDSFQEGESGDLITVVPTLADAFNICKKPYDPYNTLLIDHDLPDGNGTWFLKQYKSEFKHIIAISAIPEHNKKLLENGAQYSVLKMEKDFLDKLLNILKKRQ